MDDVLGIGILGWGGLARRSLAPAMNALSGANLLAIGTRFPTQAEKVPEGVEVTDYEGLLLKPEVGAIHLANENQNHLPWAKRALEKGKHVLCEKPMVWGCPDQVEELRDLAKSRGLLLAEGFMYRHHGQYDMIKGLIKSGRIGLVHRLEIRFTYRLKDRSNIRWQRESWGGAMADVGCYGVDFSRWILGDPVKVQGFSHMDGTSGVDGTSSWLMAHANGAISRVHVSMEEEQCQSILIYGDKGEIEIPHAFLSPPGKRVHFLVRDDKGQEVIKCEPNNTYLLEWKAFLKSIQIGTLIPPFEDGLENARVQKKIIKNLELH